jgi:four helix bundle protein
MDFAEDIFSLSNHFPKTEIYNLTSQILRASDSIALNISKGATNQRDPEFRRFLTYFIRSNAEVVTCLHKANRRKYISSEEFENNYEKAFNLMNMLIALKNKLK